MPDPISPCRIGTSVSVAKYMNARHHRGKEVRRERIAAHRLADPVGRDHPFVSGPA